MILRHLIILSLLCWAQYTECQIEITEVMSSNTFTITDEDGDTPDWIEIYNPSNSPVSLEGFFITDNYSNPQKWTFPNTASINSHEYLIVWASSKDEYQDDYIHTSFKISQQGETLYLHRGNIDLGFRIEIPKLLDDQSFGTLPLENGTFYFKIPSPGKENKRIFVDPVTNISIVDNLSIPSLSPHTINLINTDSCQEILYSIDGSYPTIELKSSSHSIDLDDEQKLDSYFSHIPTREQYRLPSEVPRFHHVRVQCLDSSTKGHSEDNMTFVLSKDLLTKHTLPIVFLDVVPNDFFSPKNGIYVAGDDVNHDKNGSKWKSKVRWKIFEKDKPLEFGEALAEIHGHATRSLPQKSLKLTSIFDIKNDRYGSSKFASSIDTFQEIVLRSFHSELIRKEFTDFGFRDDIIMNAINSEMKVYAPHSRLCVLYINGEYWGLHSLRESSEVEIISKTEGIPEEDIQIQKGAEHIFDLYEMIKDLDSQDSSSFLEIERLFDIENLVDYILTQMWFNNLDWPFNNIKTWKEKGRSGPYRFILFDLDATMKYPRMNAFERFIPTNIPSKDNARHYLFFEKLLSFKEFQRKMEERYLTLLDNILSPNHLLHVAENTYLEAQNDITRHSKRWHYPKSLDIWNKSYEDIKEYIMLRKLYFGHQLLQFSDGFLYPNPVERNSTLNLSGLTHLFNEYMWVNVYGQKLNNWIQIEGNVIDAPNTQSNHINFLFLRGPLGMKSFSVVVIE